MPLSLALSKVVSTLPPSNANGVIIPSPPRIAILENNLAIFKVADSLADS